MGLLQQKIQEQISALNALVHKTYTLPQRLFQQQGVPGTVTWVMLVPENKDIGMMHIGYLVKDRHTSTAVKLLKNSMEEDVFKRTRFKTTATDEARETLSAILNKLETNLGLKKQDAIDEYGVRIPAYQYFYFSEAEKNIDMQQKETMAYSRCYCAHYERGQRETIYDFANAYILYNENMHAAFLLNQDAEDKDNTRPHTFITDKLPDNKFTIFREHYIQAHPVRDMTLEVCGPK